MHLNRSEATTGKSRKKERELLKEATTMESAAYEARHSLDGVAGGDVVAARTVDVSLRGKYEHIAAAACILLGVALDPSTEGEDFRHSTAFRALLNHTFVDSIRRLPPTSISRRQAIAASAHLRLLGPSCTLHPTPFLSALLDWMRATVTCASVHFGWDRNLTDTTTTLKSSGFKRRPATRIAQTVL